MISRCRSRGWQADFNDASNFLDLFRTGGGNNWGNYSNPAFDRMLEAAQNDPDIDSRGAETGGGGSASCSRTKPSMPLFFWVSGNLVRPYVKGWVANAMDIHQRPLDLDRRKSPGGGADMKRCWLWLQLGRLRLRGGSKAMASGLARA